MIRALKAIFGLAQREDATSSELLPSMPAAEAELAAAREAQAAAAAAYRTGLLSTDEAALRQLDAACRDSELRLARAKTLVETLRERLAEAREREAEAERVAVYQAARQQADDARRALAELYPQLASDLVQVIEFVARAEVEVIAANADLPHGVEPLAAVESTVRDIPAEPDEIISEAQVERWVKVGNIQPATFDQTNIYKTGPRRGVISVTGVPVNECTQVELRTFIERTVRQGRIHQSAYRLYNKISLPGIRANDPDFWKPLASGTKPDDVVRNIEVLRYAQPKVSLSASAEKTHLVPLPGAERVKALDTPSPSRPFRGSFAEAPEGEARA